MASQEDNQGSQNSIESVADGIDIWKTLFEPDLYTTLHAPFPPITLDIEYFNASPDDEEGESEHIQLSIFPFYTMNDIKMAIYAKKKNPKFAPQFQFLAEYTNDTYQAIDSYYLEPGSKIPIVLDDPFRSPLNKMFVDDAGMKKTINLVSRSRTLYEDTYLYAKKEPVFRLFLLSDLVSKRKTLANERRYLGMIKPYFNSDSISNTTTGEQVPQDQSIELKKSLTYFLARSTLLKENIEPSFAKFIPVDLRIEGIKSLRLVWLNTTEEKTVDTLFYEQSVNLVRPFLRLLPLDGVPVTKLHILKGAIPVPALADPCLLLQWAQEKNPASKNDFLFGKIDIGEEYATLQALDDGTAAIIVQPRKGQREFEAASAELFKERIQQGIKGFPFATEDPQLNEMSFQASITIKGGKIERREMSKRLEAFSSFFQEIPPPPNSPSLIALRYKAVSNFYTQDRVQLYISQLFSTKIPINTIKEKIANEFEITLSQADKEVTEWFSKKDEIVPVVPKYAVFRLKYNPGIDINITAHHPTYTFQIDRVDSVTNLQRVLSLLSLMMTYSVKKPVEAEAVKKVSTAVVVVEEEGEAGEAGEVAEAREAREPEADEKVAVESQSKLSIANYFIKKLQEADPTLFELGEEQKSYGVRCQFAQMKQPAVLSEKQYQRMMTLYADNIRDEEVDFVEVSYKKPVPSKESKIAGTYDSQKEIDENTFMVLKYGTSLKNQKYYICSEYFCIEDEIPIRASEFENPGTFRPEADNELKTKQKLANHCPFCNGSLIDKKQKKPGATVYKRDGMDYIGFYSKDVHPAHWGLPCCFVKKKFSSKAPVATGEHIDFFKIQRDQEKKAGTLDVNEDEEEEQATNDYDEDADIEGINYEDVLNRTHDRTIVKDVKFPLDITMKGEPAIGLVPSVLDTYFQQNPDALVTKGMSMRMKPNSEGVFRIAVDNRPSRRQESFFSAIAPFFKKNSASDVRQRLLELFSGAAGVKLFISINFGNLMLEFYTPSQQTYTAAELTKWAVKYLNPKRSQQYPYIARIKKSYDNFINFLQNPKRVKEYRQFAHLLAQPNIFMKTKSAIDTPGILFVVIEMTDEKHYTIRCPPFGITNAMKSCDIGFLIHREEIWEPLFFLKNDISKLGTARHIHTLRINKDNRQLPQLRPDVFKIIQTFRERCANQEPTVYTGIQQLAIKDATLPDLTSLITIMKELGTFVGVIRDVYNHVVAVTIKIDNDNEIAFPVLDDGFMQSQNSLAIYFGWEGFAPAPVEIVWEFYMENQERFTNYAGYKPMRIVRLPYGKTRAIKAIQLENGIYIPVGESEIEELPGRVDDVEEFEFEWTINEKIGRPAESASDKKVSGDIKAVSVAKTIEIENEVDEIFQSFRLSVSNWLLSKEGTPWKIKIEEIIMSPSQGLGYNLSVSRKRELLQILLGDRMKRFIETDQEPESKVPSVLRVDCRKLTEADCVNSSRCAWKPEEKRCLLHVKKLSDVATSDMEEVFLLRLIEELIRFPRRRAQILQERGRRIGTLSKLSGAVRMIDQYIVPEDTSEWADLLNMDCKKRTPEIPRFFEEFSREHDTAPVQVAKLPSSNFPEFILNLLEGDSSKYELLPLDTDRIGDSSIYDDITIAFSDEPQSPPFLDKATLDMVLPALNAGFAQFSQDDETPQGFIGDNENVYIVFSRDDTHYFLVEKNSPISPINKESLPETLSVQISDL